MGLPSPARRRSDRARRGRSVAPARTSRRASRPRRLALRRNATRRRCGGVGPPPCPSSRTPRCARRSRIRCAGCCRSGRARLSGSRSVTAEVSTSPYSARRGSASAEPVAKTAPGPARRATGPGRRSARFGHASARPRRRCRPAAAGPDRGWTSGPVRRRRSRRRDDPPEFDVVAVEAPVEVDHGRGCRVRAT